MKLKKVISVLLILVIFTAQLSWMGIFMPKAVYAESSVQRVATKANIADKFFFNQLSDDAKVFYEEFDKLLLGCDYERLKTELGKEQSDFGVNSLEVTSVINSSDSLKTKLTEYTKGNQDLLNTMGAARDAYMADHAGLFYVDASNLSLRVTQDQEKNLHAFIGKGRTETYINKAFWDYEQKKVDKQKLIEAIDTVTRELNKAVEQVRQVKAVENQNLIEQQILKAHDLVISSNAYKLEETIIAENEHKDESEKGDPWNVRTVYGAFGPKHEIVCEGFSRAFKMILDEMDIPCVLVYGAYVSSTKYEEHMWNYVQLENEKWYAVDTTWDNTDQEDKDATVDEEGKKERISGQYFLAGQDIMSLNHLVTGIMSVANYEFKYPELEKSSDKYEIASEIAGLRVEMDDEGYDADDDVRASKFKISYFVDLNENGVEDPGERMGYKAARKHGYYMVATLMSYFVPNYDYSVTPGNPNDESWGYSGYFGYIDEIYGAMVDFYEDGTRVGDDDDTTGKNTYLSFYNANANYLQFGVTTDKPEENKKLPNGHPNPKAFTYYGTSSDMVALSNKIYNKNGERVKAPYIKTATPVQNSTMIIGETYKCEIVYDEDLVQIDGETIEAKVKIEKSSNTEYNNYSLTNFHFDGQRTITFDFKPSDLYADDSVYYTIDMMGLKGKDSKKRPMPASYFCAHKCSAYAYKSQGIDWNVYGKPTLMDDVNLDEMTDEQNADLAELLKHRMTLVTTTTKPSEEKAMKEFLNDPETVDKSTGKNLDVGGDVVKTETYNIRLTLCKMQKIKDGQAVRVMLGFPEGYGPEDAGVTFKAYHYIKDEHGNITGVEEIPCMVTELGLIIECRSFSPFTIAAVEGDVEENKTRTVLFQTSEGGDVYDVYNGENDENNKKSNKLVLDEKNNEATITIKPVTGYVVDDIVIGEQVIDVNGDDVESVSLEEKSNAVTYTIKYDDLKLQNYEAVVAKVAFIPETIKNAEKAAGYEVVAQPISQPAFTMSAEVKSEAKNNGPFDEADEFEVEYKITDMKAVGEQGIVGIGALLNYNRENLELKSVTPGDGWKIDYNSADNSGKPHNLVATYDIEKEKISRIIGPEDGNPDQIDKVVFTAKFMVLENENVTENVSLSHIEGSMGEEENIVKANDIITNINIEKVEDPAVEEKLELLPDATCKIEGEYIKNVEPGLKVSDMKKQLSSESVLPVKYFKTDADSERLIELSDTDAVTTGTVVKVGEKKWTIIVTADLDGNGELTINDIVEFKLDYIGEKQLDKIYLIAADVDGLPSSEGNTSVNDLVFMIYKYNDMELE